MRSGGWRLQRDAEREILLPWLDSEPDPFVRLAVIDFIDGLIERPDRPHLEDDDSGVFAIRAVPGTSVTVVWVIDPGRRFVVLISIG